MYSTRRVATSHTSAQKVNSRKEQSAGPRHTNKSVSRASCDALPVGTPGALEQLFLKVVHGALQHASAAVPAADERTDIPHPQGIVHAVGEEEGRVRRQCKGRDGVGVAF